MSTAPAYRSAILLPFLIFSLASSATPAAAQDAIAQSKLYGAAHTFDVIRKGNKVGTYVTRFSRRGGNLTVTVDMDIRVGIIGIPVFRYTYDATETWSGNRLASLKAKVNNNGKRKDIAGAANGRNFTWTTNGKRGTTALPLFPTHHWHIGMASQKKVFNSFDGAVNKVTVRKTGAARLNCNGRTVTATGYRYSGELDAQSWYDGRGRWVALRLRAEDGSRIDFLCPGGAFVGS